MARPGFHLLGSPPQATSGLKFPFGKIILACKKVCDNGLELEAGRRLFNFRAPFLVAE